MKCPVCEARAYVYSAYKKANGSEIRRNLKCVKCGATFATVEKVDRINFDPRDVFGEKREVKKA